MTAEIPEGYHSLTVNLIQNDFNVFYEMEADFLIVRF